MLNIKTIEEFGTQLSQVTSIFDLDTPIDIVQDFSEFGPRWVFLNELKSNNYKPSSNFTKAKSLHDSLQLIKSTEGVDRLYHTLEFIAYQNRVVFNHVEELISVMLNG